VTGLAAGAALRSFLFVPGDSERKQVRALGSGADALILDLEDSVDPANRAAARTQVARLLAAGSAQQGPQLWVRVSAPSGAELQADLRSLAAVPLPQGIVIPKVSSAAEIIHLGGALAALESAHPASRHRVRILALVTETPAGLLALPQYPQQLGASVPAMERLAGFTWGGEDLGAALGASHRREPGGAYTFTFQLARTQCLLAAAALGIQAVDAVHVDFRDGAALVAEAQAARRDGFSGKLAIHPDQLAPINAAFTPTEAEVAHARRVIAAMAAAGGAGVATLDGQMIDRPHLLQAQRTLAAAGARL